MATSIITTSNVLPAKRKRAQISYAELDSYDSEHEPNDDVANESIEDESSDGDTAYSLRGSRKVRCPFDTIRHLSSNCKHRNHTR